MGEIKGQAIRVRDVETLMKRIFDLLLAFILIIIFTV